MDRIDADERSDARLAQLTLARGVLVGSAQILALLPGISRSGVTMVAGLAQGLSHRDAARFSFLLATPVILAAGVLKLPDLAGPLGAGITGQVLAGSLASFAAAYLSVRFLERYFPDPDPDPDPVRDLQPHRRSGVTAVADPAMSLDLSRSHTGAGGGGV